MKNLLSTLFMIFTATILFAQNVNNNAGSNHGNKFEQMGANFPTPNEYRTASGAPGPKYWQQRCDYDIKCELDEKNLKLTGSETVTYFNNSPDVLHTYGFSLMKTSIAVSTMLIIKQATQCRTG